LRTFPSRSCRHACERAQTRRRNPRTRNR
jgi:hypothetical protein